MSHTPRPHEAHHHTSPPPAADGRCVRSLARLAAGTAAVAVATAVTVTLGGLRPASAVVDGQPTSITDTPWQVSLQSGGGHFCGGSVLDATTILTAAHCVEGVGAADITVRAGVTDRTDASGQDRSVARVVVHPGGFDAAADVALLVLSSPLRLGSTVQPIALATPDDVAGAGAGRVSGWGAVAEDDPSGSDTLLAADVPLVDDASCQQLLGAEGSIASATELCAEGVGAGSCYGDSGGPLTVVAADGSVRLAGVVSWGAACAVLPGVFAEVPAFAPWIAAGGVGGELPASGEDGGSAGAPDDVWSDEPMTDEPMTEDPWADHPWSDDDSWIDDGWSDDDSWIDDGWSDEDGWIEDGWIEDGWSDDDGWSDEDGWIEDGWSDDDGGTWFHEDCEDAAA